MQARVYGRMAMKADRIDNIVDNVMRRAELGEHRAAELVFRIIGVGGRPIEVPPITVNQHGEKNQTIIAQGRHGNSPELEFGGDPVEASEGQPKQLTDMHAVERHQNTKAKRRRRVKAV